MKYDDPIYQSFFPIQVLPYPPQWAFKQHAPYDA